MQFPYKMSHSAFIMNCMMLAYSFHLIYNAEFVIMYCTCSMGMVLCFYCSVCSLSLSLSCGDGNRVYACIAICFRLQHKVLYIFVLILLLLSSIFCFDYSKTIFYMLHLQLYLAFFMFYLQEHESTTVGLMLGLAASYKGTMQPAISKVNTRTSLTFAPFSSIFVLYVYS